MQKGTNNSGANIFHSLPTGEQSDGSVVDHVGKVISLEQRLQIISAVEWLPATFMRDDIRHAIDNHRFFIVQWATWSGKTTQVPKIALECGRDVVVTQPRVIAATSNAERISDELLSFTWNADYSLGRLVWYRTGHGSIASKHTKLALHTDGLELMRQTVSWIYPRTIILDEAHNYSIPTEILGMLLKYRTDIQIIIMSATLDPTVFQEFFRTFSSDIPVLQIPGRTYPVTKYMNDRDGYIESIATAYKWTQKQPPASVLVFAPGKREIEDCATTLREKLGKNAPIYQLHAELPKEEQQAIVHLDPSVPRIVIATNVAEESITIPYTTYVVDLATGKQVRFNNLGIQELRLENVAQSSCLQRAWRCWRTHPWIYIRANDTPYEEIPKYPSAPIEREMLDRYILQLLANGMDIVDMENEARAKGERLFFHDFDETLLKISLHRLHRIGAIDASRKITTMGHQLIKFPLDIYHARMLYEWLLRHCSEDMVYIVAILEQKWFVSKNEEWKKIPVGKNKKISDLLGYVELFKIITSTQLTDSMREKFLELWVDPTEMQRFIEHGGTYKFYEVVNLAPVGIKNRKVQEIERVIELLKERLESSGIPLENSDSLNDKRICIATGSLHNVYTYDEEAGNFSNNEHRKGSRMLRFRAGNVATAELQHHGVYLGQPFIIWWTDGKPDLNLLTFLTQVDASILRQAELSCERRRKNPQRNVDPKQTDAAGWLGKSGAEMVWWEDSAVLEHWAEVIKHGTNIAEPGIEQERIEETLEIKLSEMLVPNEKMGSETVAEYYAAALGEYQTHLERDMFHWSEDARTFYLSHCLPLFLVERNVRIRKWLEGRDNEFIITFRRLLSLYILEQEWHRVRPKSIEATERSFLHDTKILDDFLESENPYIREFLRFGKLGLFKDNGDEVTIQSPNSEGDNMLAERRLIELKKQYFALMGRISPELTDFQIDQYNRMVQEQYFNHLISSSIDYKTICDVHATIGWMSQESVMEMMRRIKQKTRKKQESADSSISLSDFPMAQSVYEWLVRIWQAFFEPLYYSTMIEPRVLDAMKRILRNQITENVPVRSILEDFLSTRHYDKYRSMSGLGQQITEYHDSLDNVRMHVQALSKEMRLTKNLDFASRMITKFEIAIERLREAKKRIMADEILKEFM